MSFFPFRFDSCASEKLSNAYLTNLRPHDSSNACAGVKRASGGKNSSCRLLDIGASNENDDYNEIQNHTT
jgi:hypothetical protein